MKVKSKSEVAQSWPTLATPWTAAYQAPPSMGFSRQKYWSGVPLHIKIVKMINIICFSHTKKEQWIHVTKTVETVRKTGGLFLIS